MTPFQFVHPLYFFFFIGLVFFTAVWVAEWRVWHRIKEGEASLSNDPIPAGRRGPLGVWIGLFTLGTVLALVITEALGGVTFLEGLDPLNVVRAGAEGLNYRDAPTLFAIIVLFLLRRIRKLRERPQDLGTEGLMIFYEGFSLVSVLSQNIFIMFLCQCIAVGILGFGLRAGLSSEQRAELRGVSGVESALLALFGLLVLSSAYLKLGTGFSVDELMRPATLAQANEAVFRVGERSWNVRFIAFACLNLSFLLQMGVFPFASKWIHYGTWSPSRDQDHWLSIHRMILVALWCRVNFGLFPDFREEYSSVFLIGGFLTLAWVLALAIKKKFAPFSEWYSYLALIGSGTLAIGTGVGSEEALSGIQHWFPLYYFGLGVLALLALDEAGDPQKESSEFPLRIFPLRSFQGVYALFTLWMMSPLPGSAAYLGWKKVLLALAELSLGGALLFLYAITLPTLLIMGTLYRRLKDTSSSAGKTRKTADLIRADRILFFSVSVALGVLGIAGAFGRGLP